jgi:DNA-binding MarR family transcriptional regulator
MGLTQVQVSIIDYIYRNEQAQDIFQRDVEHEFNIQKSSATTLLKLMEKRGLIVRVAMVNDSRYKKILLTPKARKDAVKIHSFLTETDTMVANLLGDNADQVIAGLETIADALK